MASNEPMPLYFFRRTPSEKKYSPGASVVAASKDPIITRWWECGRKINKYEFEDNGKLKTIRFRESKSHVLKFGYLYRICNLSVCLSVYNGILIYL